MPTFQSSKADYEKWMVAQLGPELIAEDLAEKSRLMRESAFVFLRATYWRWSEIMPEICPELASAPAVLSVGDIHLENFGTWRDAEGRLVFGVNDFDEAAEMPYVHDLVRLATSALLGSDDRKGAARDICKAILSGYKAGLDAPRPVILDKDWQWLRDFVVVPEERRQKFWRNLAARQSEPAPPRFQHVLQNAMPEEGVPFDTARHVAGTGSLGRPRWVAVADWRGAMAVREAKALLTSGWSLARSRPNAPIMSGEIAGGRFRSPDPWYRVADGVVVRRLSPNNRKIEAGKRAAFLYEVELHEVMGLELANLHLGTRDVRDAIKADFEKRSKGWLAEAAEKCAAAVTAEFKQYRKS